MSTQVNTAEATIKPPEQPTPTLEALYRAILLHPDEDTPRLMYADAIEEYDPLRAELIRVQFRLKDIGPKRKVVHTGVLRKRGGPNYCQFVGGHEDGLAAGNRVDVVDIRDESHVLGTGLVITKIEPDDPGLGTTVVTAKRDAGSVPYPHAEQKELHDQEVELLINAFPHQVSGKYFDARSFDRGFLSHVRSGWAWWRDHGADLCAAHPITDVAFPEMPPLIVTTNTQGRMTHTLSYGYVHPHSSFGPHEVTSDVYVPDLTAVKQLLQKTWPSVCRWHFGSEQG
jgi:uncharacterized protein (TIGR02996 family)